MKRNPIGQGSGQVDAHCGDCVWHYVGGRGRPVDRCRRFANQRIEPEWPGCASHTQSLDCLQCGACCREAYDAVEVGPRDPFVRIHPGRLEKVEGRLNIQRSNGVCGCLNTADGSWACAVYADRPRTCREFVQGGPNCVDARVRLGLTP